VVFNRNDICSFVFTGRQRCGDAVPKTIFQNWTKDIAGLLIFIRTATAGIIRIGEMVQYIFGVQSSLGVRWVLEKCES
jgi:hypothetical protein